MNRNGATGPAVFDEVFGDELEAAAAAEPSWVWRGYLAHGNVTLLTSQWKTGKSTLVSVLLAKRRSGGALAGLPVAAGGSVVVSEEGKGQWALRGRKFGFGREACFLCRPFRGKPRPEEWQALLDRVGQLRELHGADLLVIDTLASFLPGRDESNAGLMLEALLPLQRLTAAGMAVLLAHHPRKGEPPAGQEARGSGALSGYADILVEMACRAPGTDDRRRRLRAYSRSDQTPRELVIELNADGTDYACHGDFVGEEFAGSWERLRAVLEDAARKLPRQELLKEWPADFPAPGATTLVRWLDQAAARGLVRVDGTGRKRAPVRSWLPGQEEKWADDPFRLPDLEPLPPLGEREVLADAVRKLKRANKARGRQDGAEA